MPHLELKWSDNALQCIRRAYTFLAVDNDNKDAAKAAVKTIRQHANKLSRFPQAGKPADDLDPEHRELIIPFGGTGYTLIYEVWPGFILILAVRHQRQAGYQFPE